MQAEEEFPGAVDRNLIRLHLQSLDLRETAQPLSELFREIGHLIDPLDVVPVDPAHDLLGPVGSLAEICKEEMEVTLGEAFEVDDARALHGSQLIFLPFRVGSGEP